MRVLFLSLLVIVMVPGSILAQAQSAKLSDVDQVRLTVFKKLLGPWLPEPTPDQSAFLAKAFYFSIEGEKDPSKELMQALGKARVPYKVGSRSFISDPDGSVVLDKKTRQRGVLFLIYRLTWKSKTEAVVSAGNHEGNMSAYSCDYTVRVMNGEWQIDSSENCVIS